MANKSSKRFGARYGRRIREKYCNIEKDQRKIHKCPYCSYTAAKRESAGIWNCRKCNSKFTGRAYTLSKVKQIEEAQS